MVPHRKPVDLFRQNLIHARDQRIQIERIQIERGGAHGICHR